SSLRTAARFAAPTAPPSPACTRQAAVRSASARTPTSAGFRWLIACTQAGARAGMRPRAPPSPVLSCSARGVADGSAEFLLLEHRLDGDPARALQREPDRLRLPPGRAEPVLASGVLEVQEHLDGRILPDQPAGLDEYPLSRTEVAHERVTGGVQEQQPRHVVRDEPVDEPPDRVVPLGVVAALSREPDVGVIPLVADIPGRDEELVLDDVDPLVRLERDGEDLAGMVGADGDEPGALCLHHDQGDAGEYPVPAALHAQ